MLVMLEQYWANIAVLPVSVNQCLFKVKYQLLTILLFNAMNEKNSNSNKSNKHLFFLITINPNIIKKMLLTINLKRSQFEVKPNKKLQITKIIFIHLYK